MTKEELFLDLEEKILDKERLKLIKYPLLKKEKVFILGQMAELGQFSEEEHKKVLEQISNVLGRKFLVGEEFLKFQKDFSKDKDFQFFKNIEKLVEFLKKENLENCKILTKGSNSIKLFELKNKNLL
jgi:UDP-N-acetylmuramoyl-tripeptide--D-alanyl-D-alanine ligase